MNAQLETMELASLTTKVRRVGDGPPVLLIQGLGTDHRAWNPVVEQLSGHVQCITYDNRGVGDASSLHESFSLDDFASDAAEIVEALDEGPVHVCGVSMGGGIAMRFAARYPQLTRSLALHATLAIPDRRTIAVLEYRKRLWRLGVADQLLQPFIALFAWGPSSMNLDALPEGAADVSRVSEENYMGHLTAAQEQVMTDEELGRISCPTLVVAGSKDIITTPDHSLAMHKAIPGSRMITVEGGHAFYVEDPKLFAAIQLGWVLQHA